MPRMEFENGYANAISATGMPKGTENLKPAAQPGDENPNSKDGIARAMIRRLAIRRIFKCKFYPNSTFNKARYSLAPSFS